MTDLGALNCCYSWINASAALAINAHGDVAGFTSSPTDPLREIPFIYQNGAMTAITDNFGRATSINDAGEVTGFFLVPGTTTVHAFRYLAAHFGGSRGQRRWTDRRDLLSQWSGRRADPCVSADTRDADSVSRLDASRLE